MLPSSSTTCATPNFTICTVPFVLSEATRSRRPPFASVSSLSRCSSAASSAAALRRSSELFFFGFLGVADLRTVGGVATGTGRGVFIIL